jgi:hypothetical protein
MVITKYEINLEAPKYIHFCVQMLIGKFGRGRRSTSHLLFILRFPQLPSTAAGGKHVSGCHFYYLHISASFVSHSRESFH